LAAFDDLSKIKYDFYLTITDKAGNESNASYSMEATIIDGVIEGLAYTTTSGLSG